MSDHPAGGPVDLMRRLFAAFHAGDRAAFDALTADDIVWTVHGEGPLAGRARGRAAFVALLERARSLSRGRERFEITDTLEDGHRAMLLAQIRASADFGRLDIEHCYLIESDGRRLTRGRTIPCDQAAFLTFWRAAEAARQPGTGAGHDG